MKSAKMVKGLPPVLEIRTEADLAAIKNPLLQIGRSVTSEIGGLLDCNGHKAELGKGPQADRSSFSGRASRRDLSKTEPRRGPRRS